MLSRRPLLYLTIPSLALLLGLWFRRKKAIASSRANNAASSASGKNTTNASAENNTAGGIPQEASRIRGKRDISESVPIGSGPDGADENSLLNTSGCSSTSSDKGGRPTSGPNSRSPPIPITNKPGCGGHTSDELNSVDEFDVASSGSAADLAGSYELRNFEFVKNNHLYNKRTKGAMDVPVKVITASKSPKISPKNAFSEATSTPATKKQQQSKPQQTPKSPKEVEVVKQRADESLSSPMAKLSLDDTKNNNTTNVKKSDSQLSSQAPTKESTDDALNNNNNKSTQGQQEPEQQQQPPTANSPPLSLYSNDSGKGSSPTQSDVATAAGGVVQSHSSCYEFLVHERNVGVLIGRGGATVKKLHKRFKVHMIVRLVPNCPRPTDRVCAIMGAPSDIEAALEFIRQRMPLDRYPDLLLERVHYASSPVPSLGVKETIVSNGETDQSVNGNSNTAAAAPGAPKKPVMPNYYPVAQLPLSLSLVEGINNDVVISAILNGGHVFLQQPSHPSHQQLQTLHTLLAASYASGESPSLEDPQPGSICVAPVGGSWYRVVIVSNALEQCLVKFLDFGGSVLVPAADLRQIRADFMTVPFQCTECVLSNLKPIGGEWSPAAAELVLKLSNGMVLQAQVAGYTSEGLPAIFLYSILGPDNIAFINQELVAQGFAEWVEDESTEEEEEDESVETTQQTTVLVQ